jgi:peptide deformylase
MLDLKALKKMVGETHKRAPKTLTVYSRLSSKKLPVTKPWVGEVHDNRNLQDFIGDLAATLNTCGTLSIAAPQTGVNLQVIVVNRELPVPEEVGPTETITVEGKTTEVVKAKPPVKTEPLVLINPTILMVSPELGEEKPEFSISYPGTRVKIARPASVKVSYINRQGDHVEETLTGLAAAGAAQGIETLQGGSIIDHLPKVLQASAIRKGQMTLRRYEHALKAARAKRGSNMTPAKKKRRK